MCVLLLQVALTRQPGWEVEPEAGLGSTAGSGLVAAMSDIPAPDNAEAVSA